ncbi:MAG TPA: NADH-quinone oxidoreductase subunit J [Armatimonadota bacterium]|nr:NADH-quinone oxidoreductase subunit J [Armatimonadota bacterium]
MEITGYNVAFIAIAAMTVTSAIFVVTLPNILRSALFLMFTFIGVAGLYVLANAEILAAMQLLIYVGAITVLILFAIVLTQQLMGARITQTSRNIVLGGVAAIAVFAFIATTFVSHFSKGSDMIAAQPAVPTSDPLLTIAKMLIQPYVLPFELASFILLVAMVGAIVIAKEDKD